MSEQSEPSENRRRNFGKAKRQTDGTSGRKELAGPPSVARKGLAGRETRPPANLRSVQLKLGKRIAALRKRKRLDAVQLAKACGAPTSKIEGIERGEVNLSMSLIVRLAATFGKSIADFFEGIE